MKNSIFLLKIFARRTSVNTTLTITLRNIPSDVELSAGQRNGSTAVILEKDISIVNVSLKSDDVPNFNLTVTATEKYADGKIRIRTSTANFVKIPVIPACYDADSGSVTLNINVKLTNGTNQLISVTINHLKKYLSVLNITLVGNAITKDLIAVANNPLPCPASSKFIIFS